MAEVLDQLPRKYPWAEWTGGKVYRARQGQDFFCSVRSFYGLLRYQAIQRGMTVEIVMDVEAGTVDFTFSKKPRAKSRTNGK